MLESVYEEERGGKEREWSRPNRVVWNLEIEENSQEDRDISETMMIMIAKARWIYHKERCRRDHRQAKKMDLGVLVDRVKSAMATWKRTKR